MSSPVRAPRPRPRSQPVDPALRELEEQVYQHVLEKIDFSGLFMIEQMLWYVFAQLGIKEGYPGDVDRSKAMIDAALVRALKDPSRYSTDVPFGISTEEVKAVRFDEACPLCKLEASVPPEALHHLEDEPCAMCDELALKWREQHATKLARRGVAPPPSSVEPPSKIAKA